MLVLLVDGDGARATSVANYMTAQGHEIDFSRDGESGIALAHANRFDACIVGSDLRDLTGVEVCRRLRREGVGYPIIILGADTSLESVLAGFDAGADDVFRAPLDVRELGAKVENIVYPVKAQLKRELLVGNLRLDLSTRTLWGRHWVRVNGMTYRLLVLLMQAAPRVVPSWAIGEWLWPAGDFHPHVIRVHVCAVRRALRKCGSSVLIRSHIGLGYSMCIANEASKA